MKPIKNILNISVIIFLVTQVNAKSLPSKDSTWKTVSFSDMDTSTIGMNTQKEIYGNGQLKYSGTYRHIKLKYGEIKDYYLPVGRQITDRKNGKVKDIQNYTQSGFMLSDTIYRRNGKIKSTWLYKTRYSIILSDGKDLYFNDRFFYVTFYFKNGSEDCEGLGERKRNIWLNRRDTWKFYKKDGTFKYQLTYTNSGIKP